MLDGAWSVDTDVPKPKEFYGIASVGVLGQHFL